MTTQHHNPLFPGNPPQPADPHAHQPAGGQSGHTPAHKAHGTHHEKPHHEAHHQKPHHHAASHQAEPAVDLIRQKLERIYADAPDAEQEIGEAEAAGNQRSRHQQFIYQLTGSGKSLAQIQTEWHHYYSSLPDSEKHAVWQEFYSQQHQAVAPELQPYHHAGTNASQPPAEQATPAGPVTEQPRPRVPQHIYPTPTKLTHPSPSQPVAGGSATAAAPEPPAGHALSYEDSREPDEIKQQLLGKVSQRAKLKPRHHLQSLLFGLGCGGLTLLIVLFGFFNEKFIAPFVQPSRTVNATPIIIGTDGVAPSDKAEVIIPKINVQIPLDFSAKTIQEDDIQKALESGVVHYPTTPLPGQQGNTAFFGHSSNNIFNPGQYKFAFVLLHELVPGDTFYLTRDGVAYAYQVFDKKIIEPTEVSILDPIPGKTATATLITCDPPGTTLRRLAIIGEQVSPNPSANVQATPQLSADTSKQSLPGNAPSLWHRLTSWARD